MNAVCKKCQLWVAIIACIKKKKKFIHRSVFHVLTYLNFGCFHSIVASKVSLSLLLLNMVHYIVICILLQLFCSDVLYMTSYCKGVSDCLLCKLQSVLVDVCFLAVSLMIQIFSFIFTVFVVSTHLFMWKPLTTQVMSKRRQERSCDLQNLVTSDNDKMWFKACGVKHTCFTPHE